MRPCRSSVVQHTGEELARRNIGIGNAPWSWQPFCHRALEPRRFPSSTQTNHRTQTAPQTRRGAYTCSRTGSQSCDRDPALAYAPPTAQYAPAGWQALTLPRGRGDSRANTLLSSAPLPLHPSCCALCLAQAVAGLFCLPRYALGVITASVSELSSRALQHCLRCLATGAVPTSRDQRCSLIGIQRAVTPRCEHDAKRSCRSSAVQHSAEA
jgi:hypothetical protein